MFIDGHAYHWCAGCQQYQEVDYSKGYEALLNTERVAAFLLYWDNHLRTEFTLHFFRLREAKADGTSQAPASAFLLLETISHF